MDKSISDFSFSEKAKSIFENAKKFIITKKILSAVIASALVVLIAIGVGVVNSKKVYDLSNYLSIDYKGHNKSATCQHQDDFYALAENIEGFDQETINSMDYDKELKVILDTENIYNKLYDEISVKTLVNGKIVDENFKGLSNGDLISLNVSWPKGLEKALGVKLKCSGISRNVEGLSEQAVIDAFSKELMNVRFYGINGNGEYCIEPNKELNTVIDGCKFTYENQTNDDDLTLKVITPNNNTAYLKYKINKTKQIKNGDKCIEIVATLEDVVKDEIKVAETKTDVTAEGLHEPINSITQLSSEQINEFSQKAVDSFLKNDNVENVQYKEAHLYKVIDDKNPLHLNALYLTFIYDTTGFLGSKGKEYTQAYYDVYIDDDGKIAYQKSQISWYWDYLYELVD